jgi:hypothetical protein
VFVQSVTMTDMRVIIHLEYLNTLTLVVSAIIIKFAIKIMKIRQIIIHNTNVNICIGGIYTSKKTKNFSLVSKNFLKCPLERLLKNQHVIGIECQPVMYKYDINRDWISQIDTNLYMNMILLKITTDKGIEDAGLYLVGIECGV